MGVVPVVYVFCNTYTSMFCGFQALLAHSCLFTSRPSNHTLLHPSPWCLGWVSYGLDWRQLELSQDLSLGLSWEWPSLLLETSTQHLPVEKKMIVLGLQKCTSCFMVCYFQQLLSLQQISGTVFNWVSQNQNVKTGCWSYYVTRSCLNLFFYPNIQNFDLQDKITSRSFLLWHKPDVLCFLGKYSPFPGGLSMAKLLTWQPLPLCYLLSSPRFWETRDQRFPGSLSLSRSGGRVGENPGNEVVQRLQPGPPEVF